jgi:hypothetical protein
VKGGRGVERADGQELDGTGRLSRSNERVRPPTRGSSTVHAYDVAAPLIDHKTARSDAAAY